MKLKNSIATDKPYLILGSGGHSNVIIDLLEQYSAKIHGVLVKNFNGNQFCGYPILGDDGYLSQINPDSFYVAVAVGFAAKDMKTRIELYEMSKNMGFTIPSLIHPTAIISNRVKLGDGCHILAGSILSAGCSVGINTIVNTGAQIDHDSEIGNHSQISPMAVICGKASVSNYCFVGASSTIIENINICEKVILGAGSVVVKSIVNSGLYYGNPVRKI